MHVVDSVRPPSPCSRSTLSYHVTVSPVSTGGKGKGGAAKEVLDPVLEAEIMEAEKAYQVPYFTAPFSSEQQFSPPPPCPPHDRAEHQNYTYSTTNALLLKLTCDEANEAEGKI